MDVFDIVTPIIFLIGVIALMVAIFALKRWVEEFVFEEKAQIKADLEAWLNSEKGKQAIYSIGVLLGNAIKSGAGFSGGKGGKFKFEDLLGYGLAQLFGFKMPAGEGEGQPQERPRGRREETPTM